MAFRCHSRRHFGNDFIALAFLLLIRLFLWSFSNDTPLKTRGGALFAVILTFGEQMSIGKNLQMVSLLQKSFQDELPEKTQGGKHAGK